MLQRVALFGLVVLVLSACNAKPLSSPIDRTAGSVLGVTPGQPKSVTKDGPVRVTYYAPVGEAEAAVEISVSFDRPMVALGTQTFAPESVLSVTPAVAGRARWVGSQTLLFEPSAALPMASEFQVRVSKGLRALDGHELAEELTFSFATPALKVVRSDPADQAERERPTRALELFFNQAVSPERVAASTTIEVNKGKAAPKLHAFTVTRPDAHDLKRVRIAPKLPYPVGAAVRVRVASGLVGDEGVRGLAQDYSAQFSIYGALRVVQNAPCKPQECIARMVLTNPVKRRAWVAALRFEPPLAAPLDDEADYETDELYFGSELQPNTHYRVRIEGELRDIYGNVLEGERSAIVRTPPLPASARLLVEGELFPSGQAAPARLRVQLQNVKDARVELRALAPDEVLPLELASLHPRAKPIVTALGAASPVERRVAEVELAPALHEGKGVVLVSLVAHGRGHEQGEELREQRLLAFTDLAPSFKIGGEGGLVWVTRLSSAQPVAGARVRVVRAQHVIAEGLSDGQGLFRFSLSAPRGSDEENDELAAVVEHEGDVAFTRKYAGIGPWERTSHASYTSAGPTVAHLFTERGIYRPGDTLQLKGILRTTGNEGLVPSFGKVALRVLDSQERELTRSEIALNDYGTFSYALRIPGSISLGPLSIFVEHGPQTFETSAEVAEYKPAELEVAVRSERAHALRGERIKAHVDGRFLFGAPAASGRVFWSARYQPLTYVSASQPGFTFVNYDHSESESESALEASAESALLHDGTLTIDLPLAHAPPSAPAKLVIEASVLAQGAEAAASTLVETWPARVLAGVRTQSSLSESQQPLDVELVAVDEQDRASAGVQLEATLERRVFTSALSDGLPTTKQSDVRVGSCRKKSQAEPVRCRFVPTEPGLHLVRVRAKDERGRTSVATLPIYVYGQGAASWGESSDGRLVELKAERDHYKLGETAKLLVPSPYAEAEALITVERAGVLSVERARVGRASTLEVRVDERFVPNAFVSVLLLRPLSAEPDSGLAYRVGTFEITADVSERELTVEVRPDAAEKRPGQDVRVQLAVRDGEGKATAAELTVFAVDEGVLALTAYQTPDPFRVLYAPRALSVWTADARGSLAKLIDGAGEEKGGDEGGGGGDGRALRTNFASVAFYAPHVETDAQGHAELSFTLPDATTRYRIMAVAATRGREVGSGVSEVVTRKPLFMRPLLPRLLRAGDALLAGVAVHNDQARAIDVEVGLEVTGVRLAEAAKQRAHIEPGKASELRFAVRADSVGEARFTFSANAGKEHDALSISRRVIAPSAPETVSVTGETTNAASEGLAALSGVRRDVGGLTVSVATSALAALEAPARSLLAYEYGCTEQLSSRLIAAAALERLRKPLHLSDASFAPIASKLATEIERHQGGDGAFGLWRAADLPRSDLSAFLTAYVLIAFEQLKHAGIALPTDAVPSAKRFLASYLRHERVKGDEHVGLATRVFVVYALALSGSYDPAYAGKLFEQRAELPPFARIELAHALSHDANAKERVDTLLTELSSYVRVTGDEAHLETNAGDAYAQIFVSDVRATAEATLLLLAHAPTHALLPKLARFLSSARGRDGAWGSTQESAWALMALARYLEAREPAKPNMRARAQLGQRTLGLVELAGHKANASFQVPMRELPTAGERLLFDKTGVGTLHYVLRLSYAQSALPTEPSERGFFVERSYDRIDPAALARGDVTGTPVESAAQVKLGDYVRVSLRVAVSAARRFVLIDDPIAAGLEPVDFSLATSARGAVHALRNRGPYDHYELRDDRAVFAVNELSPGLYTYTYLTRASSAGTFVVPPTRVYEMYHPETSGLTRAQQFEVSAR